MRQTAEKPCWARTDTCLTSRETGEAGQGEPRQTVVGDAVCRRRQPPDRPLPPSRRSCGQGSRSSARRGGRPPTGRPGTSAGPLAASCAPLTRTAEPTGGSAFVFCFVYLRWSPFLRGGTVYLPDAVCLGTPHLALAVSDSLRRPSGLAPQALPGIRLGASPAGDLLFTLRKK